MSESPLAECKKESASLIKEVKKDIKLYSNEIKKKSSNLQHKKLLHESCSNNLTKVNELRSRIEDLKEGDEPRRVLRFDSKKIDEIQKLTNLKVELSRYNQLLLPTEKPEKELETPLLNEENDGEKDKNHESEKENDTDDEKDNQKVENDEDEKSLKKSENISGENVDEDDTEINKYEIASTTIKQEDETEPVKNKENKKKGQSSGNKKMKVASKENVSTKPENREEKKDNQKNSLKSKFPKFFSGKLFSRNTNNAANIESKENVNKTKTGTKKQKDNRKYGDKRENDENVKDDEEEDEEAEEAEEDEEEEDDDDDDDDDTRDNSKQLRVLDIVNGRKYIAIKGFPGQQDGDLQFEEGEILVIKKARNDGWMVAQNDKNEEGLVPSNFLKKYEPVQDENDDEQEEEFGDEIDEFYEKGDEETYNKVAKTREFKDDAIVEEEDDEDEDEVENFENDIIENDENEEILRNKTNRSDLWKELKRNMKISSKHKDSFMKDLNSLPPGYRSSTLAKYIKKARYNLYGVLWPQLTSSGLCYESLVHDHTTGDMERKKCRVQFLCSIINVKNIPLPNNTKFTKVLDRILRVCLFDGQKFLSNIMMVVASEIDPRNDWWIFNNEKNGPCLEFSEFFIRSDNPSVKLSLLFELSLVLETQVGYIELSCGWCVLNLFDEKGNAITKKKYRLLLKGGTPFEKNVKLGNEIIRTSRFSLASVVSALRNEPQLTIRLSMPSRTQINIMETLPITLIAQTTHILFINLWRRSLYLALKNSLNTETIHSPFLASFIRVLSRPDLMDVLRVCWFDRINTLTRKEKKSPDILLKHLENIFMHNVYPIMHLATTTIANHYDIAALKSLQAETKAAKTSGFSEDKLNGFEILTNVTQAPFDTIELTFNTCLHNLDAF